MYGPGDTQSETSKENVSSQDCQTEPGRSLQLSLGMAWPPAWEEIRAFSLVSVDRLPLFLRAGGGRGEVAGREHGPWLLPSLHISSSAKGKDFFVPFHFPGEGPLTG